MARIAHHPATQRLGRRLGHLGKRLLGALLDLVLPVPSNQPLEVLQGVERVLLVRPNFRIGNTLITAPLIGALRQRFPGAQVDYLGGDTTMSLLRHLPIDHGYSVSRRFVSRPWQFLALFWRLRRNRYDVAVEAGMGSFSGGMYTWLSGARWRIGCTGKGDRFLNLRLPAVATEHVYDSPVAFARLLGSDCPDHPVYRVGEDEAADAETLLRGLGLAPAGAAVLPFVAVFVGGHQDKRWPAEQWLELARTLGEAGGRVAVFLGPEEMHFADRMSAGLAGVAHVIRPRPLRVFGALWARAALIVTPDSGPMHLAAGLGVPTIAVLQSDGSYIYRPRRAHDVVLVRPTVDDVARAVMAHPAWAAIRQA